MLQTFCAYEAGRGCLNQANYLVGIQAAEGYWVGRFITDTSYTADYIILMHYLGMVDEERQQKAAQHILEEQQPDGGWYSYPGGPSVVNYPLPDTIVMSGPQARASQSWRVDGQTLSLSQKVEILERVIPVDQIPAVHAIYGALASRASSTIIFGK